MAHTAEVVFQAIVITVTPLTDCVEAPRRFAEGKQFGKIVLTP